MKQPVTLLVLALGCALVHATDQAQTPQQNRMSACQKEATASGKKGDERKAVLRACMTTDKTSGKAAKTG